MYRVNVSVTLEEQSIHIEKPGEPGALACSVEGEDPLDVVKTAWTKFLWNHPAGSVHVQLQPGLPRVRRAQAKGGLVWLVRRIMEGRTKTKAKGKASST